MKISNELSDDKLQQVSGAAHVIIDEDDFNKCSKGRTKGEPYCVSINCYLLSYKGVDSIGRKIYNCPHFGDFTV